MEILDFDQIQCCCLQVEEAQRPSHTKRDPEMSCDFFCGSQQRCEFALVLNAMWIRDANRALCDQIFNVITSRCSLAFTMCFHFAGKIFLAMIAIWSQSLKFIRAHLEKCEETSSTLRCEISLWILIETRDSRPLEIEAIFPLAGNFPLMTEILLEYTASHISFT